jgi:hypothetical protein
MIFWGGLTDDLLLTLFLLYFLASWASHCTTLDVIYDVTRVAVIDITIQELCHAQDLFNGPSG